MLRRGPVCAMVLGLVLSYGGFRSAGQAPGPRLAVTLTVVDEDGLPVSDAEVTLSTPGSGALHLQTDYAGRCAYTLKSDLPYQLRVQKPGFYQAFEDQTEARRQTIEVKLAHEQAEREEENVATSPPTIDRKKLSDRP